MDAPSCYTVITLTGAPCGRSSFRSVALLSYEGLTEDMGRRWFSDHIEDINERVDSAAERLYPRRDSIRDVPDKDRRIISVFPYFLAVCLVIWVCGIVYIGDYRFSKLIEVLCLVFVSCFAIFGVPCLLMIDKGVFSVWVMVGMAVIMALFSWGSGILLIGQVYYAEAIYDMLSVLGIHMNDILEVLVGFLATLAILFFTSIGVLSVICAYMRTYVPRVFMSMQARAGTGERGKAEGFFMVPDIIDVKEVVLEPETDHHTFHFRNFISVTAYLFILGLLISSYIFLNPLLISVMGWKTMLAVMLMLSMFIPALVLPWQIVRSVGAKVHSDAPRDYYLWTGARKRLFSTFAALGVFMMMFVLSVYLGNSALDMAKSYVSFLIPLLAVSVVYGAIYVNNFDNAVCGSICEKFDEGREAGKSPRSVDLNR